MEYFDAIIIGSGPAGYTAAIYLSRAQIRTLVLEGSQFGGAPMGTSEVENFPGFPEGINGPELMANMRLQAERFGAQLVSVDVDSIDVSGGEKRVTANGRSYSCRAVIMATGSVARTLGVDRETELTGKGVSTCATCDGFFFRGKEVAVVGGGDSAMEEALFLTRFATSVRLIHRRDTFKASPIMLDRVRNHPKITLQTNTEVLRLHGDDALSGLTLRHIPTGETMEIDIDGLFAAVGHDPQVSLLANAAGGCAVEFDGGGYVKVAGRSGATAHPGVFACGDLVDPTYRQAISAAGSGCVAALDVQHFLAEHSSESIESELATL
ncbi:thioredoxin reductase (plasmid) [Arthrobacter sp. ERGS1:01]|uniref:thioredoxin-disulfide reductase n=1 Tax=Arthrobacter sp. ERGS1:01 TaxID=1704044 RepID=UPI0006B502CC|nr:thioredoxin-disulfide reductase [Arthrobacter sp. ERGS1:01]ALE04248.1 thioredoxin reductase [Arthrobacter sp. ERGS1:01]